MKYLSSTFLVLLRLAIGWHFLVEGMAKINEPSWTSAPYLREASGPLAPRFREIAGDPVIARMVAQPGDPLPKALARDWQDWYDRFTTYYELTDDQMQLAQAKFDQRQAQTALWLTNGKKHIQKPSQFKLLPREADRTTPQRIQDYQDAVARVREIEREELPKVGDAAHPELLRAKAEAARQRAELLADLNEQTAAMKTVLLGRDLYLQSIPGPGPAAVIGGDWKGEKGILTADQVAKRDPMPDQPPSGWKSRWDTARSLDWLGWTRLQWSDFVVRWGLTAVGGLLILGLFTRTACVAGAVYLLLFYLPMPPWPGLPESPRSEGHYLYINKNVIEALALMALACTASGRWVGIDGLLALRKSRRAEEPQEEPKREVPVDLGRDTPRPDLTPATNGPASPTEPAEPPAEAKHDHPTEPPTVLYTANPKEPSHGD